MRRLLSPVAKMVRTCRIRSFRNLWRWLASARCWDWLFDRSGTRSLPPRRLLLQLESLEDRIAPSVTAIDDSYSTAFAQPLTVQAAGVLANDEGTNLSAALVAQASHGTATVNADGSLSYTPTDFTFAGNDLIVYQASDGIDSSNATITIQIQQAVTSTALAVSAESIYESDLLTLTATVTATATQAGTPAGSITFKDGATTLAVVSLNANGSAQYSTSALDIGTHQLTAEFSPTANGIFAASTSQPKTVVVAQAPVWIEAAQDDILVGDTVGFNAYPYDFDPTTVAGIEWDFNYDGTTFNPDSATTGQLSVQQTFSVAGTRTIAARILTTAGQEELGTLEVRAHYAPPVLTVPADLTITAGDTPTLAIQAQFAANASFASIEWWFSVDGGEYEQDATLTHLSEQVQFPHYGEVDVWVIVTDSNGEKAEDGFHVTIDEAAPLATATATGPNGAISGNAALLTEGQTASFTVWLTDRDILDTDSIWVNWFGLEGDENFEFVELEDITYNEDGSITFQFLYDDNPEEGNVYHAVVSIENEGGEFINCNVDVIVNNVTPTIAWANPNDFGSQWERFTFLAAGQPMTVTANDPSQADKAELTYHWKFFDGETDELVLEDSTSIPHIQLPDSDYTANKIYRVEVFVEDKDEAKSPTLSIMATVGASNFEMSRVRTWRYDDGASHQFSETHFYFVRDFADQLYGNFLPQGDALPADYNRFMYGNEVLKPIADGSSLTLQLQLDRLSQNAIPSGTNVTYRFKISLYDVEQVSIGPDHHGLIEELIIENNTGILQLPGELNDPAHPENGRMTGYRKDREIVVDVMARIGGNPEETGPSYPHSVVYTVIASTPLTPPTFDFGQIKDLFKTLSMIAESFGNNASALFDAIKNGANGFEGFFHTLVDGAGSAVSQFFNNWQTELSSAFFTWLNNGTALSFNVNFSDNNSLMAFALQYSGLTWDHVQQVLLQELGSGNLAAISQIANLVGSIDPNNPSSLLGLLNTLQADGLDFAQIQQDVVAQVRTMVTNTMGGAAVQLAAKFVPGLGMVNAIYQGLSWMLNHHEELGAIFDKFIDSIDFLKNRNVNGVATKFLEGIRAIAPTILSFAASQLGLGKLPQDIRSILSLVPSKVDAALRKMVTRLVTPLKATTPGDMFDGKLAAEKEFTYDQKIYVVWAAKDKSGTKVKVAEKSGTTYHFIGVLSAKSFDNSVVSTAQTDINALKLAATNLASSAKPSAQQSGNAFNALKQLQTNVTNAENQVVNDIIAHACVVLNAGCFAAGTKLWTPDGYRNVEEIQEGEMVFSRDECDPYAPIEAKVVEKKFERTGRILHLHLNGEVIRTTPEHPFFAMERGWVEAGALQEGDEVRTDSGWVKIEEVFDTDAYEAVYNLRIADHHTYFVGAKDWGFSAWAHNTYSIVATYATGKFFKFTEANGYSATMFIPNAFLTHQRTRPNQAVKDAVARDALTGFGNTLQEKVNSLRTAWNGLSQVGRYGSSLPRIQQLLDDVNNLRVASGGTAISLDDYDNPNLPDPPPTPNPQPGLGAAWEAFKTQRAMVRGQIIHEQVKQWIQLTQPSVAYHTTGPDVDEHSALPVWYEIYPAGGGNRATHANRPGMASAPWREILYANGR
jgi:Pretoxin HINT domain/Bacterial Ig-like domain (group 3)/Bacterial Ig domain